MHRGSSGTDGDDGVDGDARAGTARLSFWSGQNVLVTGGTGLLGSWMVDALLERGARVTCIVRDEVPQSRLVTSGAARRVNVVHGAIEDYETCLRALNEYEIATVFHLAAQTIVGTAARSALSTFESNIRGTWTLLEACRELMPHVRRVVVASSDKAYGSHDTLPYREDAPLQGRFPYDVSKSCADLIAISYAQTYGVPVTITRCGNLYGGGDWNMSRIVPGTIRSLLRGERPIVRSSGRLLRDYFYVEDAVLAYLGLAERMDALGLRGEAFNFGTGRPNSVLEIVSAIRRLMGRDDLEPEVQGRDQGEIPAQYLDCTKAREVLGWTARFSLEDGLLRTIPWYREHS